MNPSHVATLRLNAALICERVLEEKDGTLSIIRIADRLAIEVAGQLSDNDEPLVQVPGVLVLVFKRETEDPSEHRIDVSGTDPSGRKVLSVEAPLRIAAGAGQGTDLIVPLAFPVSGGGLHWVNVAADGQLLTRIPIEVVIRSLPDTPHESLGKRAV